MTMIARTVRTGPGSYTHPHYVSSLRGQGVPRQLPRSGAWILERPIPGSAHVDAVSAYPMLACRDWRELPADLDELGEAIVSLSAVTDPLGEYDLGLLHETFDRVAPYALHYVVELHLPLNTIVPDAQRESARRALTELTVERVVDPGSTASEWQRSGMALRADQGGAPPLGDAPSLPAEWDADALRAQLDLPGAVVYRATRGAQPVGLALFMLEGGVAYCHLSGYSEAGWDLGAPQALMWRAVVDLADEVPWLDLGVAGADGSGDAARLKEAWATGTRVAYACGRIVNREVYARLSAASGAAEGATFPAYRGGLRAVEAR